MKIIYTLGFLLMITSYSAQINPTDACPGSTLSMGLVTCPVNTYTMDGAYIDGGTPIASCFTGLDRDDAWFQFVANSTDAVITEVGDIDHILTVYSSCGSGEISCTALTANVSQDIAVSGLTNGNTYYIQLHRVQGNINATMTGTICISDGCGNDVIMPTGTAPTDITVQCSADVPFADPSLITDEADNCTATPIVSFLSDVSDGNFCPEIITRTYRIVDGASNFTDVVQLITVNDTQLPTASDPAPISVETMGEVPAPDPMVVTDEADNCSPAPVVSFVSDVSDGNSCPETITRTYSVTDDCGNMIYVQQMITVNDVTAPVFAIAPGPVAVECLADVPASTSLSWTDNSDGAGSVMGTDISDGFTCPETITRTWTYTDGCGNVANEAQIIVVNDTQAPTGTAPANTTVSSLPAADPLLITDEADNCTVNPVVAWVSDVSDGNTCPETITRTYSITDDCGNTTNVSQIITVGASISIDLETATDVSGCGLSDGTIEITASGGFGSYNFSIDGGSTFSSGISPFTFVGLSANSYQVVVSDGSCPVTGSILTISEPAGPPAPVAGSDATYCEGDGMSDLVASAGTGTLSWYDDAGLTNLVGNGSTLTPANTVGTSLYYVTETVAGCQGAATVITIVVNGAPTMTNAATQTICSGNSVNLSLTSDQSSTYSWYASDNPNVTGESTTPQGTSVINDLLTSSVSADQTVTYTVIPTSITGSCTGTSQTVTINVQDCSADPCTGVYNGTSASVTQPMCENDANGSINLTVLGGQAPYSFQWGRGYTTEDISNLQAGTYTVLISDANGCDTTLSFVLEPQSLVSFLVVPTDATCGNGDGAALTSVVQGTSPYNYSYTSGDTTDLAQNLTAGMYSITVTDANGCSASSIFTISDSNGPSVVVAVTEPTCPDNTDGAINLTVTGGTTPYTFSWSDGAITEDVTNLAAGIYDVEIEDANGCVVANSIPLTGGTPISLGSYTLTNPGCGATNGEIAVNATGGNGTLTYAWGVNAGNQTTATATGLGVGGYYLTVTDANGCTATQGYMLSNSSAPTLAVQSNVPVACNGSGGDVDVVITGGVAPFIYWWSNGALTQDLTGVSIGTYDLEVTDANGCAAMLSVEVEGEEPLMQSICMVTVDSATGTNLLVWEKPVPANGIAYYNIYREGSAAGVFNFVDTVEYTSLSQWTDPVANPAVRGWRYKVSAVDSCGVESLLSLYHKTIHLTISQGVQNDINLIWDDYVGFNMPTWYIERYHPTTGWILIDSIPSNLKSYTDINVPAGGNVLYSVYGVPAGGCTSTKAQDHNSTRSNQSTIAAPTGIGIVEMEKGSVSVYPNPGNGMVFLNANGIVLPFTVEVYDLQGRFLTKKICTESTTSLNISAYENGVYLLKIQAEDVVRELRLVKQ